MIALTPVTGMKVREVWNLVRPGLELTTDKHDDRWIPEDVYHEVMSGRAFLYMLDIDDEPQGFTILRNFQDIDGLALFVWIFYAKANAIGEDHAQEVMGCFDDLARKIGAKRIRHYSPRGGWAREDLFELKMHVYEREVR